MSYVSTKPTSSGFALLLTIIIIGVVQAIALTVLSLSIKQVNLSADTRDSESAFHAANAGLECIRYWRRAESETYTTGGNQQISCFDESVPPSVRQTWTVSNENVSGNGVVHLYEYEISWGTTDTPRCSIMRFFLMNAAIDGSGVTLSNIQDPALIPGAPINEKLCEPGGRCTLFSSQGFSRSCENIDQLGTIQREIFLEF